MSSSAAPSRRHILSVVVEDYFQVAPVKHVVAPRHWPRFESRIERNVEATLDLLARTGARATFFTLGWSAERLPHLFAEIARRGHEVACRGYYHRSVHEMTRAEFRSDARRAKDAVEDATGTAALGYRIAHGPVRAADLWFLDELADLGFAYDSSLRPVGHRFAAEPFRRFVHRHSRHGRTLWEIPLSSWQTCGLALPISGGNYVRQLPAAFIRRAIAAWEAESEAPLVFYFHIWELDPDQPRIVGVSALQRVRQYRNLGLMAERIRRFLCDHYCTSIANYLDLTPRVVAPREPKTAVASYAAVAAAAPTSITVVVPCYNEEGTIPYLANTLGELRHSLAPAYSATFIFVDDGSKDRTWDSLTRLFDALADCRIVRHDRNRGVAAATLTGLSEARTDLVAVIDCDCSYAPEQLLEMLPLCGKEVALVTASPYHRNGRVSNVPAWRLALSMGLSWLYRQVLHQRLATYTSCFRVYRRSALGELPIVNDGFLGITEILARLDLSGARILECPAVLEARLLGRSKMKVLKTIAGHLKLLVTLAILRLRQRAPTIHGEVPLPP